MLQKNIKARLHSTTINCKFMGSQMPINYYKFDFTCTHFKFMYSSGNIAVSKYQNWKQKAAFFRAEIRLDTHRETGHKGNTDTRPSSLNLIACILKFVRHHRARPQQPNVATEHQRQRAAHHQARHRSGHSHTALS